MWREKSQGSIVFRGIRSLTCFEHHPLTFSVTSNQETSRCREEGRRPGKKKISYEKKTQERKNNLGQEAGVGLVFDGLVENVNSVVRCSTSWERLRGENARIPSVKIK